MRISYLILFVFLCGINCLKHDLKITNDNRKRFLIENFGFDAGGELHMTIKDFKINGREFSKSIEKQVGFLIRRTDTDSTAFIEETPGTTDNECNSLSNQIPTDIVVTIDVETKGLLTEKIIKIKAGDEGFYNTHFVSCLQESVSFELELLQFNIDVNGNRNYLSFGYFPLPTLYGVFTVAYFVVLLIWVLHFLRTSKENVNKIHHLMSLLVVLKLLSLLFHSIEYHYIQTTGSGAGWRVVYYIFAGLKGIMLFILIALIGTGWTFIKPFLSDKDKKIFLIVIPLQILDNIAMIIIEETAPGSQKWFTWRDIFRLVDIICCGAILVPIIWSIKHLREASQIDGKAAINMKKLKLFREFYLLVVSYIYFTRIIVYLVDATLPFKLVWLGDFFTEMATIVFFCITGYKFRPSPQNPYFTLAEEEELRQMNIQQED